MLGGGLLCEGVGFSLYRVIGNPYVFKTVTSQSLTKRPYLIFVERARRRWDIRINSHSYIKGIYFLWICFVILCTENGGKDGKLFIDTFIPETLCNILCFFSIEVIKTKAITVFWFVLFFQLVTRNRKHILRSTWYIQSKEKPSSYDYGLINSLIRLSYLINNY